MSQWLTCATLVLRYMHPLRVISLVAITLLAVLCFLALPSPVSAAPSAVPDEGTVQVNGRVSAILPVGNRVYLGGEFTQVNGVSRDYLAAVDATTGQLTDWAPRANARVTALAAPPDGSQVYASGSFSKVNGLARWRLVSLAASSGAVDANWKPVADSGVHALAVSGNRLYIGGSFSSIDGQSRTRLALLDRSTGVLDPSWTPTADNTVRTLGMSADSGRVYAGGAFTSVSGQSRPYVASLDAATGARDGAFKPSRDPNGPVFDLAVSGTSLYTAEGGPGGAVTSYNSTTGARNWRGYADGDAQAISVLDGKVYVAGHFEVFSSQNRYAFAALDPATGALDPWAPIAEPIGVNVWELASDATRGRIYTGGDFTSISTRNHQRFAQFSSPDATPPTTISVAPEDLALNVAPDTNVEATFSEDMNASTINTNTFTLTEQGATTPVAAAVTYDAANKKAILDPSADLKAATTYTATIKGGANGAKDLAGNPLATDKVWSFSTAATVADTTPPETTIDYSPASVVSSTSATFEFSSSEADSTFECSLDGAAYSACTSPKDYANLADGQHTFEVRATDTAGNTDSTPASRSWTVDTIAPNPPLIASPADNSYNNTASVSVSGTAEPNSTVEVFEGNASITAPIGTIQADTNGEWSLTLTGVAEGSHTYTAKAKDAAGNVSAASNARTVTVDTTAPETAIDSGPSGTVNSTSATFEFSSYEAGSAFRCSLDGSAFEGCTSPKDYANQADGSHTFRVRAVDTAGNVDLTPAERTWTVDAVDATATQKTRNVLAFDGSDDRASIPDSEWLNLTSSTQRTFEFWMRTGSNVSTRQFVYEQGGEHNGFSVEISGGRLYFNAWSSTNGWRTVYADAPVSSDTIYRVAGVYHAPSAELRLYLDGVLQDTSAGAGAMPQHGDNVALGGIDGSTRDHTHAIVRSGSNLGGRIGEFRAWDHARTGDRLHNEMEVDLSGTEAGLIVLYEFSEGTGTVLNDSGSHDLDAAIFGATWDTITYSLPD